MSVNYIDKSTGDLIRVAGGGNDVLYADSPIGSIIPFGGITAPNGFLLCQGQAVSRTTYAELFAVIGTSFGSGDGSTTFNVPDLREATTKGVGLSGKSSNHFDADGVALGEFVEDRVQDHTHWTYLNGDVNYPFGTKTGDDTNVYHANADTENSGSSWKVLAAYINAGRHGATTEVKAVGVNYIIKATQVSVPADFAPVDVVENGNMKAVTSNAVAEALAVIDSPITKVGTAINGDRFWSKRTGNVVEIMIDGTTGSNIPCAQSVVVAKVPKNALTISDVCIEIDSKSLVSAPESGHKRAWVDSTGNVCVFIVMPDLAATYTGNIYIGGTYITAE